MEQAKVIALLEEAATTPRTKEGYIRLNDIQIELQNAVFDNHEGVNPLLSRAAGLEALTWRLFEDTCDHKPWLLPQLAPVFIMLCGDREHSIIARVDWDNL